MPTDPFDMACPEAREFLAQIRAEATPTHAERQELLWGFGAISRLLFLVQYHRDHFVATMGEAEVAKSERSMEDALVGFFEILILYPNQEPAPCPQP